MDNYTLYCIYGSIFLALLAYYYFIYIGYHNTVHYLKTPASLKKAYTILL